MMEISGKLGIASLGNAAYLYNQKMNLLFGALQVLILMITIFVSIFKPWKSKKETKKQLYNIVVPHAAGRRYRCF